MPNVLTITADNPDGLLNAGAYGAGALIRVQSSATEAGSYADLTGTGGTATIALVTGTRAYNAYDPAGTATTWYKTRYESSTGTRTSDYSEAFQAGTSIDAYASADMLRHHARSGALTDALDEDGPLVLLALEAAARAIDTACGRDFRTAGAVVSARYFQPLQLYTAEGRLARNMIVPVSDVFDATGMIVTFDTTGNGSYTTVTTAYRLGPVNAAARQMPYTRLIFDSGTYPPDWDASVKVEALWGWDRTPGTIVQANLVQAARFLKRRDAPFGVAGSPELGNEMRLLSKLDPDVALMVGAYKRNWGAV